MKKLKFFLILMDRHPIATTWSANWPLQHMSIVIRWEDKAHQNSTFFRFLLTIFLKYLFCECFFHEVTLTLINLFITPDILFHHQQESKVNHFGEKAKKLQKLSKIMTFYKKLTSVTFDFWGFLNMSDSVRQMSFSEQETRFNINMIFRAKFEKGHFWPPQPVKKVNKEWFKSKVH